jgi:hypothetical protein
MDSLVSLDPFSLEFGSCDSSDRAGRLQLACNFSEEADGPTPLIYTPILTTDRGESTETGGGRFRDWRADSPGEGVRRLRDWT